VLATGRLYIQGDSPGQWDGDDGVRCFREHEILMIMLVTMMKGMVTVMMMVLMVLLYNGV